jgi:hypothetical protein
MSVDIYRVELNGKGYLAVRESYPVGRPKTEVYTDGAEPSKSTVKRIREAISEIKR